MRVNSICRSVLISAALLNLVSCGLSPKREPLINPVTQDLNHNPLPSASERILKFIKQKENTREITEISFYFQALKTGYWIGYNQESRYKPASLMKIFLMLRIFREAAVSPELLTKKIKIETKKSIFKPEFLPDISVEPGAVYTVDELVERIMVYSDNLAMDNLVTHFNDQALEQVFRDFGIKANSGNEEDILTVQQYMTALLSLYNATYLNGELSKKALSYMLRGKFRKGLRAGLPEGVRLASKFGERARIIDGVRYQQLHECGIVYYRGFPYMIGVMTRGHDLQAMAEAISGLSAIVYEEVDSRFGGSSAVRGK